MPVHVAPVATTRNHRTCHPAKGLEVNQPVRRFVGIVQPAGTGDVLGVIVDDQGHNVGAHISSSVEWSRVDLQRQFDADVNAMFTGHEFVFAGTDRSQWPEPCPGCNDCQPAAGDGAVNGDEPVR